MKMWRSIRFKVVAVSLLLILFSLELIGAYFVRALTASLIRNETLAVQNQAELMATLATPQVLNHNKHPIDAVNSMLTSIPQFLNGSVYILNHDGYVLDTSAGGALIGQKRTDSVATQALLQKKLITAIRYDPLSNQHLLAVAVPIKHADQFMGLLEYVVPIENTYNTVRQVTRIYYSGSAIVLALTALLGVVLSRAITRPILNVTRQARIMASGDFSQRVEVLSDDEFGDLALAINDLTSKLQDALALNSREQERLKAIITSMGDGVISFTADYIPIFSNEAARKLLGRLLDDETELIQQLGLKELSIENKGIPSNQIIIRQIQNSLIHIHVTAINRKGIHEGFVAVLRDVTEQEKLNQSRRDFVANVSHELRTPLTSVKSYIEALRDLNADEEETRQDFLRVINQETDRMVRLTRDLLQLSGLETQVHMDSDGRIDVHPWLEAMVERFRLQAESRDIALELNVLDKVKLLGDRDLLDRVLDNLVSNALKYTSAGGMIHIDARKISNQLLKITIRDTGTGIPPEDLPHVFERFYRVDKGRSRRLGGSGLGLALAREIIERHGGRISIASEIHQGTEVTVILPVLRGEG